MPKIHPLPVLILVILSIILITVASLFRKETTNENFFLGAKNVIEEIVKSEKIDQKFFEEKTAHLPEKFAVYIKDLKSGETHEFHSKDIFPAASIYKLAVMYSAYDQLEQGKLQKSDLLSAKQSALDAVISPQNVTDPSATPPPSPPPDQDNDVAMSVDQALRLMITISDNYAAILLSQRLGWVNVDKYMESEGFAEVDLVSKDSPFVSAEVVGKLLEKIYRKEAVSQKASGEMIELLSNQKVNDRIPKYLPQGTKVAHKTGELDGIRSDVGIIYGKKGNYIFVFLSQTKDPLGTMETIANLSRDFYQELEK